MKDGFLNTPFSAKGSNACYIEKLENVPLWEGEKDEPQEVGYNITRFNGRPRKNLCLFEIIAAHSPC